MTLLLLTLVSLTTKSLDVKTLNMDGFIKHKKVKIEPIKVFGDKFIIFD